MNKKLIAVAVASALGAPAVVWAQASTVQIYGRAYMEYGVIHQGNQSAAQVAGANVSGGGGVLPTIDILQSPGSSIGLKGEEKLDGGTSAWFQVESTVGLEGTTAARQLGDRNTGVGLKGDWGNLFFGRWDTAFKVAQLRNSGGMNDTGALGTVFLLYGSSATTDGRGTVTTISAGANNGGGWPRRQSQMISYNTPVFNGFQLLTGFSTPGGPGGATGVSAAASGAKPRLWTLAAQYDNGPLAVSFGIEKHKNYLTTLSGPVPGAWTSGGATNSALFGGTDKAWTMGSSYTFPAGGGLKVTGVYTRQYWQTPGATAGAAHTDVQRKAWQLAGHWLISGPHEVKMAYTKAGSLTGTGTVVGSNLMQTAALVGQTFSGTGIAFNSAGSTGANMWQLQYLHNLSKRTQVGAGVVFLDNEANGRFALGGAAFPAAGEAQNAVMMHIDHKF